MVYASFSTPVNATVEVLWDLLIDKIEHPQKYVPGVSDVKILTKNTEFVLREMTIPTGVLREKITSNLTTREVVFTLVDHSKFSGSVINKIHISDHENEAITLEFTLNWQPINSDISTAEIDMSDTIKQAVLHTKELAESHTI